MERSMNLEIQQSQKLRLKILGDPIYRLTLDYIVASYVWSPLSEDQEHWEDPSPRPSEARPQLRWQEVMSDLTELGWYPVREKHRGGQSPPHPRVGCGLGRRLLSRLRAALGQLRQRMSVSTNSPSL